MRDYFLRPSCHQCHFTSVKRCSDFTIADWWGYKRRDWKDKDFACKGVSLILANTDRALRLLPVIKMQLRERTIDEAKRTNISLSHPFPMKENRKTFWYDYRKMDFSDIVKKWMMPEKVSWDVNIRQHHRNTDILLFLLSIITLPLKVFRRINKMCR